MRQSRPKRGEITRLVVEYLRGGEAIIPLIADEIGVAESAVKTALYRNRGTLFTTVGNLTERLKAEGEQSIMGRPMLLWGLIDDYPRDIPGCPD